ncbi:MAG: beta-ketoacyl-[acyl-carrier-protein] synthase family protein [Nitrospirota bacterium]
MRENIVITGIGILSPLRPFEGTGSFWQALCSGEDTIKIMKPPFLDLGKWPMAAIDTGAFPEQINMEDKIGFLAQEAMKMAIADSGLDMTSILNECKAGLTLGTVLGNILYKEARTISPDLTKGGNNRVEDITGYDDSLSGIASGLALKHGLNGPVFTVSTACASGTDAVGIACRKIISGRADIMFAGGMDILSDFAIAGFNSLQAITTDKVRPFDRNRNGLALGEGAAFMVLESEKNALRRKAEIYGRVIGYAARSDANHLTGPHRDGRGLASAIQAAISDAQIPNNRIDYINAHGTGTPYNDLMETKALKSAFGDLAYDIPVSSTKSMLGHSFGAAGVIEAICCLLAIKDGIIPPTINYHDKDPECDLNYTPNVAVEKSVRTSMSMSAGFGGQNSVILLAAP